ncbi:hypothetical protein AWN90_05640 [Nocardia terpenica]|uniref:Cbb3-type cytochrome c oxidase subunit 3 n=1 Tax=Nocardia terpenica TaxID=455432 RepID=A0A164J5E4_9NOCA|nr:hypothetical protein AWN90_05640 [Nocardia terpenica]
MAVQGQAADPVTDFGQFGLLLLACLAVSALVYAVITLWPQRIPKERSVHGIRERIEDEDRVE